MAIDWSEDISVGASIKKSNLSEIKGEIDRIADEVDEDLSWDHFSDEDDEPADDRIKSEQPHELRDKTEVIYSSRHTTVYSDHNSTDDGDDYDTHESGYESDDRSEQYISHEDTHRSNDDESDYGTYEDGYDSYDKSTYDGSVT